MGSEMCIRDSRWGEWPMTTWLHDFEDLGLVEYVDGQWRRVASA